MHQFQETTPEKRSEPPKNIAKPELINWKPESNNLKHPIIQEIKYL